MRHPTLFNFLIFTCFLVGGYTVSTRFYQAENRNISYRPSMMSADVSNSLQSMNNSQQSILLLGVDFLNTSNPQLTSLWLVSFLPSDPTLHFLPIFPTGNGSSTTLEDSLRRTFSLHKEDGNVSLGQGFTKLLLDSNYWWSGYFIFDQIALSEIVNFLDKTQISGEVSTKNERLIDLSSFEGNPQEYFSTQLAILQMACHNLGGIIQNSDWSQMMSLVPNHIFTDPNLQQGYAEWITFITKEQSLNCRFPTLEFSRNGD